MYEAPQLLLVAKSIRTERAKTAILTQIWPLKWRLREMKAKFVDQFGSIGTWHWMMWHWNVEGTAMSLLPYWRWKRQLFPAYTHTRLDLHHDGTDMSVFLIVMAKEAPFTCGKRIEMFLGSLLWMSMICLQSSRMYWNLKFYMPQVASLMPVNKWEEVKSFLLSQKST